MIRLYGLMIAKDEADIISQSLLHALNHCQKIIVMDNMSTDGTWEIVEDLATKHPDRIVAHCRLEEPFHDRLRAIAYNAFHHEITAQDWWLRLDADEFLNALPSSILDLANMEGADFVRANQMQFALTDADVREIEAGRDSRDLPIHQRRCHYRVNWREFRMFRNNPELKWDTEMNGQFPQNLSKEKICSKSVFNRHYAYRDIEQVKARIALRFGSQSFSHVSADDWHNYVVPSRGLHIWSEGAAVKFAPLVDFWVPRIKLELAQRLGLANRAA